MAVVANLKATTQSNIYFCISHQELDDGRRDREHAVGLFCIPIDMDVKPNDPKCYATDTEAAIKLLQFCDAVGIPYPSLLVRSGGGLHGYWLSIRVLKVEEWQPYADAVKAAAKKAGLKFDATCTGDAARVLRVPDTSNWKYDPPRLVKLIQPACTGAKYDFAEVLKPILGKSVVPKITISPLFKQLPVTPLGEGIFLKDIPPLPVEPILAECAWLREAYETGGEKFDNPQWNLTTLIATFLENGHELAHKFGNKHPTYDPAETDDKWAIKNKERKAKSLGWPHCKTIENAGSTHCATCRHRVKDKTPIHLGYEAFANPVDKDLEELGGTRPSDMRLPEGYCLDEEGRICAIVKAKRVKNSIQPARLQLLLLTVIYDPSLQYQGGKYGLGFIAKGDRIGTTEVFLHSGNCFKEGGLFKHLGEKCVLTNTDDGARKMAEKFMVSWLDKLLKEDVAIRDHGTMGWRYEKGELVGFVYGGVLYHEDGNEIPLIASADDDFRSWYTPVGSRDVWLQACKLLTDRKRPELDLLISIGFAAPLMKFAGTLYGAILSFWGDPGSSKSTAQQVAAAIWGHPKQTRESLNSTPKSVQGRLGRCRNLAAYWDDIQDERHQEALFQTMFVATQGAEGGRLNTDATMKARLEWQTLLVACSNASFVEFLIKKQKSTTAGMRRVFEIEFNKKDNEPGIINSVDAGNVFAALEQNYGTIGVEYARILAKEHKEIFPMVTEIIKNFCAKVEGTGDEAYWWGSCGVLLAGAMLANRLGAEMDVGAMEEFLLKAFESNRNIRGSEGTEGGSYANTEQGLTAFLNFYVGSGNVLVVDRMFELRRRNINFLRGPQPGHPIVVQIARDQRKIVFSKREMRDYFNKRDTQSRQIFNGLFKYFKATEVRHTLGAGTAYAQSQEVCIEIYVPPHQPHVLKDMLEAQGAPVD